MLRINLLPIRQLKKRAKARNQMIGYFMIFAAFLVALGFIGLLQINKVENVQAAIAELQQEQNRLAPIIREVDELERQKQELQNKIDVIKKLRKESSLTVHVLDEVASILDNDRMWLTALNQQGGSLDLKGVALDNQTVAQFMEALKESPYITGVNLTSSTLQKVSDRPFKNFTLSCSVGFPAEQEEVKNQTTAAQQ